MQRQSPLYFLKKYILDEWDNHLSAEQENDIDAVVTEFNKLLAPDGCGTDFGAGYWKAVQENVDDYIKSLEPNDLIYAIACGLKRFVNSADCPVRGRYQRQPWFLDIYWAGETPHFQAFNASLNKLIDDLEPERLKQRSWWGKAASGLTASSRALLSIVVSVGANPLTIILLAQSSIASAQRVRQSSDDSQNCLAAYYPFNGDTLDYSGYGNNAVNFGAVPCTDRFNNTNGAFCFNGASYMKGFADRFPTNQRTVSFWVKPAKIQYGPDRNCGGAMVGYGGNGTCGTSFFVNLNNLCLQQYNVIDVQGHCSTPQLLFENATLSSLHSTWSHIAFTTDYYSGSIIYLNGTSVAAQTNLFFNSTVVNGTNFAFGANVNKTGIAPYGDSCVEYYTGALDEVEIYNCALSAEQIYQLFSETNKTTVQPSTLPTSSPTATAAPNTPGSINNWWKIGGIAGGAVLLTAAGCCLFQRCRKRRDGYEEIVGQAAEDRLAQELRESSSMARLRDQH